CAGREDGAVAGARQNHSGQRVRPRRQGHAHRRRIRRHRVVKKGCNAMNASNARLQAAFTRLSGRTALVPYITADDPSLAATVPLMHALVLSSADIIELGIPFSDPMADGP